MIVAGDIGQRVVYALRAAQHRAAELTNSVFRFLRGFCVDEVDDSLRLCEIHPVVQKSALGKLPGQRLPRACGKQRLQPGAQHGGGAVALQLGGVLAGVARRAAADRAEAQIERLPVGVA